MSYVRHAYELCSADPELEALLAGEAAPAVFLTYQQHWICDPCQVRIMEKSRRIGITWATAADCVLEAGSGKQDVWYVVYSEDGAKEFIADCVMWCERLSLAAESLVVTINDVNDSTAEAQVERDGKGRPVPQKLLEWRGNTGVAKGMRALQVRFPSGKRITALSSNARNLRGKKGRVVIDEAGFHDDLPELLKAATALTMWGSDLMILSTHNGADNAFAQLCNRVRDGQEPTYSLHTVTITDALTQGLYKRICIDTRRAYSHEAEKAWLAKLEKDMGSGVEEELYCQPVGSGEAYIGRPLVEACDRPELPVFRFEQDNTWCTLFTEEERIAGTLEWCQDTLYPALVDIYSDPVNYRCFGVGMDFARSADLSVICPLGLTQRMVRRAPFMVELANIPHNQQWQILNYIMTRLPKLMFSIIDAGGNGSWIAEQAWLNHGGDSYVERLQLSQGFYKEHMASFKQAHEDRLLEYPRDADIRRDMAQIRRINGIAKVADLRTQDMKKGEQKRHGDAAIALFLANTAIRRAEEIFTRWEGLTAV